MAYTKASTAQIRMLYGVAKKAGMDNDVLHARCYEMTKQEHISQLSSGQCAKLIDSIQGKPKTIPYDNRPANRASQMQINVILGLAKKMGWLENGDKKRLNAFLKERYNTERLDWLEPGTAVKVTEALKAMLKGGRQERIAK